MTILGIDVGGTCTDAVLLNAASVQAKAKVTTTDDISAGIHNAIANIREQCSEGVSLHHLIDAEWMPLTEKPRYFNALILAWRDCPL